MIRNWRAGLFRALKIMVHYPGSQSLTAMKIEYLKTQIVTVVTIALAGFFLLLASKWLWRPGSTR